jgi:chemotaxis signal transduction protein
MSSAARLRANFDASFGHAHATESPPQLDLLLIQVAEHDHALRLDQVSALHVDRKLVQTPGPRPELLGLVGVRGVVAPVYDLRRLLGYSAASAPRWLAVLRASAPLAVAFEQFERHLRVPQSDLVSADAGATSAAFVGGRVRSATKALPLIDLLAIFDDVTLRRRSAIPRPREERQ